ncbi:peptide ABC transporter substrate-binding protein [Lacticaseibacillus paracasei]|uniref:peptide ABC transporter substrate-binding protein n=1 Tax=Lacticaseibacillus paracasei TaxID=1597 RepID=UPI00272ACD7B|nr:peptide ABC transporter substrate-binding protein [Lacticaseibacillus paracasei]WKZ96471.1 peptide ABC transporter substrate-binding protein [Lacticaseibacillus paracasei]
MFKLKKWTLMLPLAALALVAAGCSSNSSSSTSQSKKAQTLNWSEISSIVTNDPSMSTDTVSFQMMTNTQEGIYRLTDKGQKTQLALAKKVTTSKDGMTYNVTLRNAKWSNGDPITAQDFVYSWQRTVDPKTKATDAFYFAPIKNASAIIKGTKPASDLGIKATDSKHLTITLENPTAYFKKMLAFPLYYPQNQKTVEKYGKSYGTTSSAQVYSGPFKLTKWNGASDSWTLVKNPEYWDKKNVKLSKVNETVIKDVQTGMNLYQTNKLDSIVLTGEQAAAHLNDKDAIKRLSSNMTRVDLNQKQVPAFKNLKIRQAFSMVVDRNAVTKNVLKDGSKPALGFVPIGLQTNQKTGADFAQTTQVKSAVAYNKAKAKKLFAEGMKESGQSELNLTLLADDADVSKQVAEYLQGAFESLPHVKVTIKSIPKAQRLQAMMSGNYDMVVTGWQSIFADAYNFLDVWISNSGYNTSGYKNTKLDQLLSETETKYGNEPQKRWTMLQDAEKILMNDQGTLPLYQANNLQLLRPTVKGVSFNPNGTPYDFKTAYIK